MIELFLPENKIEMNREASALLRKIKEHFKERCLIEETKDFWENIVPVKDPRKIKERADKIKRSFEDLSKVDIEKLENALSGLKKVRFPEGFLEDRVLIVRDEEFEKALSFKLCKVIKESEIEGELPDYPLVLSTFELERSIEIELAREEIVPDLLINEFGKGEKVKRLLSLISGFPTIFEYEGPDLRRLMEEAQKVLNKFEKLEEIMEELDSIVEEAVERVNEKIRERLEALEVKIKGTDVLELYRGYLEGVKPISEVLEEVQGIIEEEIEKVEEELSEKLGIPIAIFKRSFPVEVDLNSLEELKRVLEKNYKTSIFMNSLNLVKECSKAIKALEKVYRKAIWIDFCLSILRGLEGKYAFPESSLCGTGFINARSLFIRNPQPVTYFLGKLPKGINIPAKEARIAILTGANSGGKSTLIETFATVQMLSQMGLPVPAESSWYDVVDSIKIFRSKRRIESAGALESVLRFLVSLIKKKAKQLILIDELVESVTEPGAAAKILGKILELILKKGDYCIVVSHLGEELMKYLPEVRVDGIEASGLSEDLSLIVDRQPKFGKIGKSTPELIVERLYRKSRGREKEIFCQILEAFKRRSQGF